MTKQNWYEPLARAFISARLKQGDTTVTQGLIDLPAQRAGSLRIRKSDGAIVASAEKAHSDLTKSVDFAVYEYDKSTGKVFAHLVSHKHTDDTHGGGQDNQKIDGQTFLDAALKNSDKRVDIPELRERISLALGREVTAEMFDWRPALILDGDYHTETETEMRESIDKKTARGRRFSFIGSGDDFVAHMGTAPADRVKDFDAALAASR